MTNPFYPHGSQGNVSLDAWGGDLPSLDLPPGHDLVTNEFTYPVVDPFDPDTLGGKHDVPSDTAEDLSNLLKAIGLLSRDMPKRAVLDEGLNQEWALEYLESIAPGRFKVLPHSAVEVLDELVPVLVGLEPEHLADFYYSNGKANVETMLQEFGCGCSLSAFGELTSEGKEIVHLVLDGRGTHDGHPIGIRTKGSGKGDTRPNIAGIQRAAHAAGVHFTKQRIESLLHLIQPKTHREKNAMEKINSLLEELEQKGSSLAVSATDPDLILRVSLYALAIARICVRNVPMHGVGANRLPKRGRLRETYDDCIGLAALEQTSASESDVARSLVSELAVYRRGGNQLRLGVSAIRCALALLDKNLVQWVQARLQLALMMRLFGEEIEYRDELVRLRGSLSVVDVSRSHSINEAFPELDLFSFEELKSGLIYNEANSNLSLLAQYSADPAVDEEELYSRLKEIEIELEAGGDPHFARHVKAERLGVAVSLLGSKSDMADARFFWESMEEPDAQAFLEHVVGLQRSPEVRAATAEVARMVYPNLRSSTAKS